MNILNTILVPILKRRMSKIESFMRHPHDTQKNILKKLLATAKNTEFGKRYNFCDIIDYKTFRDRIPINTYEQFFPYIDRIMHGEQNILWPSKIKWFAKSSGTTNARSKFIPVSPEALKECHFKGGQDMLSLYVHNYPDTNLFSGKSIAIGGSYQVNEANPSSCYGDISAVIMMNLPGWAQYIRTPGLDIALMENWEEKIDLIASHTSKMNVTNIAGAPPWVALLLQHILKLQRKEHILEVWPHFEVFFHGAVAFPPYKNLFKSIIPSEKVIYWNIYNASEGIFGMQSSGKEEDMLLMLDYGVFYEFIPTDQMEKENPKVLSLDEVDMDTDYAVVISTNAGLWRYNIGDTVKFTCLAPYRIKILGRTKHFINVFGEEVVIENAETAITEACDETGAVINNFTVGPIFIEKGKRGSHEWVIEFKTRPPDIVVFTCLLDASLRKINSDYDAKRSFDLTLTLPKVNSVSEGTFYNWMKKRGKLGGQNKVPRLSNSREYIEDILR